VSKGFNDTHHATRQKKKKKKKKKKTLQAPLAEPSLASEPLADLTVDPSCNEWEWPVAGKRGCKRVRTKEERERAAFPLRIANPEIMASEGKCNQRRQRQQMRVVRVAGRKNGSQYQYQMQINEIYIY
jgi:hypothetical protein